jgi:hypothetical protein
VPLFSTINPTRTGHGANLSLHAERQATNHLNHGTPYAFTLLEAGYFSHYSDWLRDGRQVFHSTETATFSLRHNAASRPSLDPVQWVHWLVLLGINRLECKADHSPRSSAEAKKVWSRSSTSPHIFKLWCFIKHRDNFAYIYFAKACMLQDDFETITE